MNVGRLFTAVLNVAGQTVLQLIRLVAWSLSPFRLGRLLRAVSVPRLSEHPLRTSLTTLGIALGVAMLVAVVVVNDSVIRGISATVDDLAGKTDLQVSAGTSGFDEDLVETIRATAGVDKAVPALQQSATIRDPRARGQRILVLGVDMVGDDDASFRDYKSPELEQIRRDPLPFLNARDNLLLSRTFAERYGYKVHDTITLATGTGLLVCKIWGLLDSVGVGRAFGGAVGVMHLLAMQSAFDRGTNVDRVDIRVAPEPRTRIADVAARLQARLGSGFIVEAPSQKGERVGQMLLSVRSALTIASLIAVLVGAFLIYNTMSISVAQRKREIGILRALGTRRREVSALLTLEGAVLGGVGSLFGVAIGVALSQLLLNATTRALDELFLQVATSQVHIGSGVVGAGLSLGTLAATLASALPAYRAAKHRPAEMLRSAGALQLAPRRARFSAADLIAFGLIALSRPLLMVPPFHQLALGAVAAQGVLLLAGALLVPRLIQLSAYLTRFATRRLGPSAQLAHANLPRDLGRTAATASALMAGVALAVAFGTFTHCFATALEDWIVQTLPGDLFVTQGSAVSGTSLRNIPMADTLYEPLRRLPGVETVRRIRVVDLPFRGFSPKAMATDMRVFVRHAKLKLLEGEQRQLVADMERGQVAISENFARRFNVHKGGLLALSTQAGTRQFRVAGVVIDYTSDFGTVLFDRATYTAAFHDARVDTYELHLRAGADTERVRSLINERYGSQLDLFVLTNREFRAEIDHKTDQVFSLVRALELVALIVAVLGIINAQLANVIDRVREIGVLRALGMRRRQVSAMIVIEALMVGALGTLAGVLLGIALGDVLLNHVNLVQTGWYFPYRLSLATILEVVCLTLPAAAIAGLYPARAAAALVITDALEFE